MMEPWKVFSEVTGSREQHSKEVPQLSLTEESLNDGLKTCGRPNTSREGQSEGDSAGISEGFQEHFSEMVNSDYEESVKPSIASSIVDFQRQALLKEKSMKMMRREEKLLHCPVCSCLYVVPITLNCGHTLCKGCILSDNVDQNCDIIDCTQCGSKSNIHKLSVNVLVTYLIQKWFPHEFENEVTKLEDVQRGRPQAGDQRKVVEALSNVLNKSPFNFKALKWRSHALYQMGMLKEALRDAELACVLRPFLPFPFYQRGLILFAMDNLEKAALNFGRAVALDSTNSEYHLQLLSCLTKFMKSESYILGGEGFLKHFEDLKTELTSKSATITGNKVCSESANDNLDKTSCKSTNSVKISSPSFARSVCSVGKQIVHKRPSEECTQSTIPANAILSKRAKLSNINAATGSHREESSMREKENFMQESHSRKKEDVMCEICYNVFFQPVTTTCGHTFCRYCLQRTLDFKPNCPYCRQPLDCTVARNHKVTTVIKEVTEKVFPDDYAARESCFANETARWKGCGIDVNVDVPIFVCMLAFPSLKYPLHIFEPRYRLMIRQCVELGSRTFGMCTGDPDVGFSEYGTMLYIDKLEVLTDGRYIIQTTAKRRFRVISRAAARDGYNTAKVEWLDDETSIPCAEQSELESLNNDCRKLLELWFNSLSQSQQNCITNAIGPMPPLEDSLLSSSNCQSWVWWALAAIPLQDRAKLIILSMTSLEERLRSIRRFLELLITMSSGSDRRDCLF